LEGTNSIPVKVFGRNRKKRTPRKKKGKTGGERNKAFNLKEGTGISSEKTNPRGREEDSACRWAATVGGSKGQNEFVRNDAFQWLKAK